MEAVRQKSGIAAIRNAIVNPARLTSERRIEVCLQCHLETTTLRLPGSLVRYGRGVFSYQPGEPLGAYALYFDHAPGKGHDDKFEFVSAAYDGPPTPFTSLSPITIYSWRRNQIRGDCPSNRTVPIRRLIAEKFSSIIRVSRMATPSYIWPSRK